MAKAAPRLEADNLVDDLVQVASKSKGTITRNFYRANGSYSESQWQEFFPTWRDFLEAAGLAENLDKTETNEIVGDLWNITLPKTRICTLEQLLEYTKVDLSIWEVERFVVNKWEMGYRNEDGDADQIPLFQVKATLRRRNTMVVIREEIEALKNEVKALVKPPKPVQYGTLDSGNLLELTIPDLHAGKLAWSKETGYQDYDLSISIETYRRAIDSLLEQAKGFKFDKIILAVGNDLLQTDNIQGTTYSGTKVDADGRYKKVYVTVRKMLCEVIEKLRLIAPVEVKLVPGNHDTLSTFTLGDSLECMFDRYHDVRVDNDPKKHKVVEWGDCFLLLTHGHEGKQSDYGVWMASQYPEIFGRTKFREVHAGHKHKSALDEKFGIRIRTLSALCPPDVWHADNLFVGNLRTAEAMVWNKTRGMVASFYHNEIN